ncbi:hypothetical protein Q5752_000541 [Cryptotrichosporon argae]
MSTQRPILSGPPLPKPRRGLPRSPSDPVQVSAAAASSSSRHPSPAQPIYVLAADGSSLWLVDPSKPRPNEEPPPYAPFTATVSADDEPPATDGYTPVPFPSDGPHRHRASTLSALPAPPSLPEAVLGIASPRSVRSRNHQSLPGATRTRSRSSLSSPAYSPLPTERTPLLSPSVARTRADDYIVATGDAESDDDEVQERGTWRSIWCGDLEDAEEAGTWGQAWKRFWRPVGTGHYWRALLHLSLINFPFALLVWPPLLAGTLAGTALLITLPIGAVVWWLTLIIARSAARFETLSQIHYHQPLHVAMPEYHPIFYRVKLRSAPGSPLSPIGETPPEIQWEKKFLKCSWAMFSDHYSYSALSYFLLIKPVIVLFSTILVLALLPMSIALVFALPVYLRAARRWGKWQAGVAMDNLGLARRRTNVERTFPVHVAIFHLPTGDTSATLKPTMDYASNHARRRAEKDQRAAAAAARASYYAHPALHMHTYLASSSSGRVGESDAAPVNGPAGGAHEGAVANGFTNGTANGVENGGATELPEGVPSGLDKGALEVNGEASGTHTSPGPPVAVVAEAMRKLEQNGQARAADLGDVMDPHLQLMCGPLLAYYTVKDDVWHGAALVVTLDEGSILDRRPFLDLSFRAYAQDLSTDALPAPAKVHGERIYTYRGAHGSSSFWRFWLAVPLADVEMAVRYRLNGGAALEFVVPARGQNMRWVAHSCNGFSGGVDTEAFKGPWQSGYDPLWEDVLAAHAKKPYHCLVGGGDQIYCDALTNEPELQRRSKIGHPLTEEMKIAVDRFYFNHYCKIFRSNAFGRANSTIPMTNMLDDHDLIDGFGTYDDETQAAPVLSYIGGRGYFWFLLFQLFVNDEIDGTNPQPGTHPVKSLIIGAPGPWIPFPSHSLIVYLGPKVYMLALDCRAERKRDRVVTVQTYDLVFSELRKLPPTVEQLVMLLGVPIAYPRLGIVEHLLNFKYNPVNILARHNALGLGGLVNKFNQASELLDDLEDHWASQNHKAERNRLILRCQALAGVMGFRITFLSGDVHLATVSTFRTYKAKVAPEHDHRFMLNVVSSAIVNTPPPEGLATLVAILGAHKHRTLHGKQTDEVMLPVFKTDTDGSTKKRPLNINRRNYASIDYLDSGALRFDIRVEKSQGAGETVGYPVEAPAPRWTKAAQ